jgi:flagellar motor switch protein FliN/FliY
MSEVATPIPSDDAARNPSFRCLPSYSRSLLKIKVPVSVTLATSRLSIGDIVELVPGTILQFDKMCDETLGLEVGGIQVAEGETVKVGDKFGLRLTSIVLPEERFVAVVGKRSPDMPDQTGESAPSSREK